MKKIQLFLIALLVSVNAIYAQSVQISGTVTHTDDGTPVIGARIQVKGTTTGTASDINGAYKITIPASAEKTLIFSSIGLAAQEVSTPTSGVYNVSMESDALNAEEVVVTGYGSVNRKSYGGAAAVVSTEKLKDVPTVSVQSRLAGNVSGLTVTSTSGQPGAVESVRVRGMGSINAGNEPLYVIDGVPMMTGNAAGFDYAESGTSILSSLNPNDIETMTVIKDAAAASLYGSRAANGVIVITTKKGSAGKTTFNVKADMGFSNMAIDWRPVLGGDDRAKLLEHGLFNYAKYEGGMGDEASAQFATEYVGDYAAKPWSGYTDWRDLLFRTGFNQNYEITAAGGNEKTRFYASLAYTDQQGITYDQDYTRYTGRVNLDHKSGIFTLGVSELISSSFQSVSSEGTAFASPFMAAAMTVSPSEYPYLENGDLNLSPDAFPALYGGLANPLWEREVNYDHNSLFRSLSNVNAQLDLFDGFAVKQTFSYDYLMTDNNVWWDPRSNNGEASGGVMQRYLIKNTQMNSQTMATYNKVFAEKHNLSALVAFESEQRKQDWTYASGSGYPTYQKPDIANAADRDASSAKSASTLLSVVGKVDYTYDNRFYLGASFRRDGSSRLAPDQRWGNFWAVSGFWRFANESWWKNGGIGEVITDGKLRASYGENGTQPADWYGWQGLYGYGKDYNGLPGSAEIQFVNDALTWERNLATNIGLDLNFWSRLQISFDWYNRDTKDLILAQPITSTSGFGSMLRNVGSMRNQGYEIDIRGQVVQTKDVSWTLGLNLAHNKNTLTSLNDGVEEIIDGQLIHRVGESYYSIYTREYAGVDPETGSEMFYTNKENADGSIDRSTTIDPSAANYVITGSVEPIITGGLNSQLSYKWLDFGFTFTFSLGGNGFNSASWINANGGIYNYLGNVPAGNDIDKMWKNPGDIAELPKFQFQNPYSSSSRWMFSTDYLRLKNLTIGFSAPEKWTKAMHLQKARIFAAGANLFTVKSKDCVVDPELPIDGIATFQAPALRTFTFGIEIGF